MNLKQETVKLSLITFLSIVGGFIFNLLLVRKFGPTQQLDSFFIILTLYSWLALSNSLIASLYIPVFNEVKKASLEDGLAFADVAMKWSLLISILVVSVFLIFDNFIIKIIAPGFTAQGIALSKEISHIVIFALIFSGIASTALLTLNALYYYSVPALTDLMDPVLNVAALFILAPVFGIKAIAISCLVLNFLDACILIAYLHFKTGWRPTRRLYHPGMSLLLNKSSKMTFNSFIWSSKDLIIRNIASRLGEGAVTIISYAEKFTNIIIQATVNPLTRVFYSRIAEWAVLSKWNDIKLLFDKALRINLSFGLFISACSIVFSPSLLRMFLFKSSFNINNIHTLSIVFNIMLGYFIIVSLELCFSRIIMAVKRTGVITINAVLGIIALFLCLFVLVKRYGIYSLPLSALLAQALVLALFYIFTRRYLAVSVFDLVKKLSSIFFISSILLISGLICKNLINNDFILVFCVMPIWLILYFLMGKRFLKSEFDIVFSGWRMRQ
jgi:putative peptidoglycan lipid II flippase